LVAGFARIPITGRRSNALNSCESSYDFRRLKCYSVFSFQPESAGGPVSRDAQRSAIGRRTAYWVLGTRYDVRCDAEWCAKRRARTRNSLPGSHPRCAPAGARTSERRNAECRVQSAECRNLEDRVRRSALCTLHSALFILHSAWAARTGGGKLIRRRRKS
jgi:hypothetical protein